MKYLSLHQLIAIPLLIIRSACCSLRMTDTGFSKVLDGSSGAVERLNYPGLAAAFVIKFDLKVGYVDS